ncbi:hypothetical protein SNEBB_009370 [Seison nebaliae]|nr:hypothetical protein SNEBB_009370 [Seison nebaliae]
MVNPSVSQVNNSFHLICGWLLQHQFSIIVNLTTLSHWEAHNLCWMINNNPLLNNHIEIIDKNATPIKCFGKSTDSVYHTIHASSSPSSVYQFQICLNRQSSSNNLRNLEDPKENSLKSRRNAFGNYPQILYDDKFWISDKTTHCRNHFLHTKHNSLHVSRIDVKRGKLFAFPFLFKEEIQHLSHIFVRFHHVQLEYFHFTKFILFHSANRSSFQCFQFKPIITSTVHSGEFMLQLANCHRKDEKKNFHFSDEQLKEMRDRIRKKRAMGDRKHYKSRVAVRIVGLGRKDAEIRRRKFGYPFFRVFWSNPFLNPQTVDNTDLKDFNNILSGSVISDNNLLVVIFLSWTITISSWIVIIFCNRLRVSSARADAQLEYRERTDSHAVNHLKNYFDEIPSHVLEEFRNREWKRFKDVQFKNVHRKLINEKRIESKRKKRNNERKETKKKDDVDVKNFKNKLLQEKGKGNQIKDPLNTKFLSEQKDKLKLKSDTLGLKKNLENLQQLDLPGKELGKQLEQITGLKDDKGEKSDKKKKPKKDKSEGKDKSKETSKSQSKKDKVSEKSKKKKKSGNKNKKGKSNKKKHKLNPKGLAGKTARKTAKKQGTKQGKTLR